MRIWTCRSIRCFFCSRVRGGADKHSDIDIGIEGSEKIDAEVMERIRNDIDDLPILYKMDIVDFKDVSEYFYIEAKKDIEIIY